MAKEALVLSLLLGTLAAPPAPETPLFTFVQVSDTHIGPDPSKARLLGQIVKDINGLDPVPAFVLVTGDLTEDGKPGEYEEYKKIFAGLKAGIAHYACPGNHETTVGRWADFEKQIGPLYRSFVHKNCLFLLTNGTRDEQKYHGQGYIDDAQFAWIKGSLEKSAAHAHVFLANHFPLADVWGRYNILGEGKNGDLLRKLVNDHKVTAWLGGHRHFDAYHHDGVTSHVSCGWVAGYGGSAPPGYRVYTVFSDRVESRRVLFSQDAARFKVSGLDYVLPNPRARKK
jgi:3',5'-cyclic AMP phosphodiesterase CpdA